MLKPLPSRPYQLACWKKAQVNIDYHVELGGHWYSVPYTLVGKPVEVRHTNGCVEVFLAGRRVASHVRSAQKGRIITQPEHMLASHRQHAEWTPSRLIRWAEGVGPSCAKLAEFHGLGGPLGGRGVDVPGEQEAECAPAAREAAPAGMPGGHRLHPRPRTDESAGAVHLEAGARQAQRAADGANGEGKSFLACAGDALPEGGSARCFTSLSLSDLMGAIPQRVRMRQKRMNRLVVR